MSTSQYILLICLSYLYFSLASSAFINTCYRRYNRHFSSALPSSLVSSIENSPWRSVLSTSPTENKRDREISIVSWNVLAQFLLDQSRKTHYSYVADDTCLSWNFRLDLIIEILSKTEADVICLQEIQCSLFINSLMPRMKALGYVGVMQDKFCSSRKRGNSYSGNKSQKKKQKKKKRQKQNSDYGVATFWKKANHNDNKWEMKLQYVSHRSRTMITILRYEYKNEPHCHRDIAILNCHLEGDPKQSLTRVRQLHSSISRIQKWQNDRKKTVDDVIICGDFNCEIFSSACTTYLQNGSLFLEDNTTPRPIQEWGYPVVLFDDYDRNVNIDEKETKHDLDDKHYLLSMKKLKKLAHSLDLSSAYDISKAARATPTPQQKDSENYYPYITYASQPGYSCHGIDHIWYSTNTMNVTGLFPTYSCLTCTTANDDTFIEEEKRKVLLKLGAPNPYLPSDHLPIGVVLNWSAHELEQNEMKKAIPYDLCTTKDSTNLSKTTLQQNKKEQSLSPKEHYKNLVRQVMELTNKLRFDSEEQKTDWLSIISFPNYENSLQQQKTNNSTSSSSENRYTKNQKKDLQKKIFQQASLEMKKIFSKILKLRKEAFKQLKLLEKEEQTTTEREK